MRVVGRDLKITQRNLPHWQRGGATYFITFVTRDRISLPVEARQIVVDTIRFDDGKRFDLLAASVMPDHVHLLLRPMRIDGATWLDLAEINKPLKGISSRRCNQLLRREGSLWLDESMDSIMRTGKQLYGVMEYIWFNPVVAGLARTPEEYPYNILGRQEILGEYAWDFGC
jgi:putative transposase